MWEEKCGHRKTNTLVHKVIFKISNIDATLIQASPVVCGSDFTAPIGSALGLGTNFSQCLNYCSRTALHLCL